MSPRFRASLARELRRLLRQPLVLAALLLQLLGAGWLLRGQLDQYLSLQAGGLGNLSVGNDLLTPMLGALAALLLLAAPLLAAALRPALQVPYRRLAGASAGRWLLPTVLAGGLLLLLVPTLVWLHLLALRSASAIAWWPLLSAGLGLVLLAGFALLLTLWLSLQLRQLAAALATGVLAMIALAALELQTLLPTPLGVFRVFRDGALPLAGVSLLLASAALLRGLIVSRHQQARHHLTSIGTALAVAAAIGALWLPQRWQPDTEQTLTGQERQVLQQLPADSRLVVVSADPARQRDYLAALALLTAQRPALALHGLHPDQLSAAERDALPGREGLLLSVGGQSAWLKLPSANLARQSLHWLSRLQRRNEQFLVFLDGHGERQLFGSQARDLAGLRQQLTALGIRALPLQLQAGMAIPSNTAAVVLASPTSALLPAEQAALTAFLARGGNLLWLREPDEPADFAKLGQFLGLHRLAGTVLDLAGVQRGTPHPAITLIDRYPPHPALANVRSLSALPWAAPLQFEPINGFRGEPLLITGSDSVLVDNPDLATVPVAAARGPFTVGWALQRAHDHGEQRIVVLGDGHFVADTAINNYGNRALAIALLQWLAFGSDAIAALDDRAADADLLPSALLLHWYRWGLPLLLPLLVLLGLGWYQWRWRTR